MSTRGSTRHRIPAHLAWCLSLAGLAIATTALNAAQGASPGVAQPAAAKVLHVAFSIAETGFDPAQIQDNYSRTITPHIFEALYQYDPLARPVKVRPLTAAAMPEASADYRTWTVKIRPGIYFASDPAFKGRRRELTAEDYVYSFKRFADPKVNSPAWSWFDQFEFTGLRQLREQSARDSKPFDYDKPLAGLKALDRYTLQFKMDRPDPRFINSCLVASDLLGAVAREVIEFYGDDINAHPVGTGPFKLAQWRRSSFIALERNPEFREMLYDAEPRADDAAGQAILKQLKGRRLPMIDRVEVSIIEESQPRWLSFLNHTIDLMDSVPIDFIQLAIPGGKLAPNLARQGVQAHRMLRADVALTLFNMEDPIVGGYTPEKIALRRAIFLGVDLEREIRLVRRGQAIVAQSPVMPNTSSFDPSFKSENGEYSVAKARALLDLYGYVDRDGDGWRDMPDGSPLVLKKATQPDQLQRQLDEQWKRDMTVLGIRIEFVPAKWPENLKAARAGKLQMWGVGSLATDPDGQGTFQRYHSKQIGGQNMARFRNQEMDDIYERMSVLPDGPERLALFDKAKRLSVAYAPYKTHVHRMVNDLVYPWVIGYRRPVFWNDVWQYLDIDASRLPAH